jgi:hypothetical protein
MKECFIEEKLLEYNQKHAKIIRKSKHTKKAQEKAKKNTQQSKVYNSNQTKINK